MAVAVRAFSTLATAYASAATTATVTKPSGTASGDVLVCAIMTAKDTTTSPTAPTGWTMTGTVAGGTRAGANGPSAVFWKAAGTSEATTYAFTVGATSILTMWALTGANTAGPITTAATFTTGTSATIAAPSVTGEAGGLLLCGYGVLYGNAAVTFTTPSGMTATSGNLRAGNYECGAFFHQALTIAGATGTRSTTASQAGTTPNQAMSVTIAPAATTGGGSTANQAAAAFLFGGL